VDNDDSVVVVVDGEDEKEENEEEKDDEEADLEGERRDEVEKLEEQDRAKSPVVVFVPRLPDRHELNRMLPWTTAQEEQQQQIQQQQQRKQDQQQQQQQNSDWQFVWNAGAASTSAEQNNSVATEQSQTKR
jgi:hypothetical protein